MTEQSPTNNPNGSAQSGQTPGGQTFEQFLQEVGQLALAAGRAAGKAAEDLTGLMVLQTNADLRARMDDLVEAGLAKNRGDAALTLLRDGIASNQNIYQQVEKTRARIASLRSQLRGLIGEQS